MENETDVLKDRVDWRGIPSSHNQFATDLPQVSKHGDGHPVEHAYQSRHTSHCQSQTQMPETQQQAETQTSVIPIPLKALFEAN